MDKTRVLFLCTGNSARSQMAEAFLRRLGGDAYEVHSAGLEPAAQVHPLAVKAMAELGYDLSDQRPKGLQQYLGKVYFGYLITVCADADAKCPVFPGMGMRLHWGLDDPAAFEGSEEEKVRKFREVRDLIKARIEAWLAEGAPGDETLSFSLNPPA